MSGKWLMNSDKHMNKTITEKRNFAKARFFFNTQRKELVCYATKKDIAIRQLT